MDSLEPGFIIAASAVAGALFGSYANVVAWRRAARGSWRARIIELSHRSSCPRCGHRLDWLELTPVVGWVLVSGTCRTCRSPISPAYPLTEFTVALVSGVLALLLPLWALGPALVLAWVSAPWLSRALFRVFPGPTKNPLPEQGVEGRASVGTSANQL